MRYWVSWYSGNYEDEGCTKPPFTFWISGYSFREKNGLSDEQYEFSMTIEDENEYYNYIDTHGRDDCTICALIDANSEDEIWPVVAKHFPDYRVRFCELRSDDYDPRGGGRFIHDGEISTSLTFKED